jgi:hypothetical protein
MSYVKETKINVIFFLQRSLSPRNANKNIDIPTLAPSPQLFGFLGHSSIDIFSPMNWLYYINNCIMFMLIVR